MSSNLFKNKVAYKFLDDFLFSLILFHFIDISVLSNFMFT